MGSLLTNSEKQDLQNAFNNIHDTFARPIFYFQEAKTVVLNTVPSYNPIYGQAGPQATTKQTIKNVIQSGQFSARITYDTDRAEAYLSSPEIDSQLKLRLPDGYVRIKVDESGHNIIQKTKRVVFDGRRFSVESDVRPHGLFLPTYYTFFLLPTER